MLGFLNKIQPPTDWHDFLRRFILNKYVLVLLAFGLVFLFVGDQSIINSIRRQRKINQTKARLEQTRQQINECRRDIRTLDNTDSLERFAREHYYMHADNEDVYIIKQ